MTALRVLALHGYSQNASIFSKRIAVLRKGCPGIDFVFVDAPTILQPADLDGTLANTTDVTEEEAVNSDPALTPRAWVKPNPERTRSAGLEDAILFLRDVLAKEGPFDGVFGFSQGAAMAAFTAALLERPQLHQAFLLGEKPPHPPLKFCISVSGFIFRDALATQIYDGGISTPILHVIGKTDVIVIEERSKMLVDLSLRKRVEYHEGGHFVPSKATWRKFFAEYMRNPTRDVPSPGSSSTNASAPGSGAGSPLRAITPMGIES